MAETEPGVTLIRGARLVDPAKRRAEPTDVLVEDGVIRAVGTGLAVPEGARVIEADGPFVWALVRDLDDLPAVVRFRVEPAF